MGLHFGNLYKLRGIVYYKISPYEQRALNGVLSKGFYNILRNIRENCIVMGIPFTIGYVLYQKMEHEHEMFLRKNPKDFENDE